MLETLAAHASYPFKLLYSNLWFFTPILAHVMSMDPMGNALARTTTAVTIIK